MSFSGFDKQQFQVFELAGFAERMAGIKERVRPPLLSLGQELAPALSRLAGHTLYPHVALHARRRVNPPQDTWVAFGRETRGYKAYAHFAVGIEQAGLYVALVLKDESDDRQALGRAMVEDPERALELLPKLKGYRLRELAGDDPTKADRDAVCRFGDWLSTRKAATFHLSKAVRASDRRLGEPEAVRKLVLQLARPLAPLYRLAAGGQVRGTKNQVQGIGFRR